MKEINFVTQGQDSIADMMSSLIPTVKSAFAVLHLYNTYIG